MLRMVISRNNWQMRQLAHMAGTRLDFDLDENRREYCRRRGGVTGHCGVAAMEVSAVGRYGGRQRGEKNTSRLIICESPVQLMAHSVRGRPQECPL
jgi:hypothetical protein